MYSALHADHISTCPKRFLLSYKELKRDKDIHITKADKSNALVILDKADYKDKLLNLLEDHTTYQRINKNPIESVNSRFNKTIKQHPYLI